VLGVEPLPVAGELDDEEAPLPLAVVLEDEDPPHAVSSNAADASPAATAHPLLRITLTPFRDLTRFDTPESYQNVRVAGGHLRPT
jgi:hypothetical protein